MVIFEKNVRDVFDKFLARIIEDLKERDPEKRTVILSDSIRETIITVNNTEYSFETTNALYIALRSCNKDNWKYIGDLICEFNLEKFSSRELTHLVTEMIEMIEEREQRENRRKREEFNKRWHQMEGS